MKLFEITSKDIKFSVEYHDTLNPKLWDGDKLQPEVREKLLTIANAFQDYLSIPNLTVEDIVITGSNANFNWTEHSDVDLHLIVNLDKLKKVPKEIVPDLLKAKRTLWADEHDITLKGMPVEVYAQDDREPHVSSGVFSVKSNKWIKEPTHEIPTVNDSAVKVKAADLINQIDKILSGKRNPSLVDKFKKKLVKLRKAGLAKAGEFSTENLVFKILRDKGYIDKATKYEQDAINAELSMDK